MDIDVRPIRAREFDAWAPVFSTSMGTPSDERTPAALRALFPIERCLGALDDGHFIGSAASMPAATTAPGGASVPAAIVTAVGVLPTHRRRGVLTTLMRHQLRDIAAADEPLALLRATEAGIYGRFGYGPAAPELHVEVIRHRATLHEHARTAGRLRIASRDEARGLLPDLYARAARLRPGEVERGQKAWDIVLNLPPEDTQLVVHHGPDGAPDGYALYELSVEKGERVLEVSDHHALTDAARVDLWRYLLDIDLVERMRATIAPDDPLPWLLADVRALRVRGRGEGPWLRIVDVPAALGARAYATTGRLVIRVHDPWLEPNDGVWLLDTTATPTVTPTADAPDLDLSVGDLASIYLGGVPPSTLARAARIIVTEPEALRLADQLFAVDRAPFVQTPM